MYACVEAFALRDQLSVLDFLASDSARNKSASLKVIVLSASSIIAAPMPRAEGAAAR